MVLLDSATYHLKLPTTNPLFLNEMKIADVWSCGVTLYVMLVGAYPFEDPDEPKNFRKTIQVPFLSHLHFLDHLCSNHKTNELVLPEDIERAVLDSRLRAHICRVSRSYCQDFRRQPSYREYLVYLAMKCSSHYIVAHSFI